MRSIISGVALTLLAFIVYKIITAKLNGRRYRAESARRGCAPAPTLYSNNLLGTSRLKESIKATKEDRGPQYVVSAINEVGTNIHTLRVPILDYELLVTRDPENVKAMFSTQSSEYDISATRSSAFMPLLGEGIFTSTGQQWKHSRALVRPQFSREEISNLDLVERHVRTLMRVLKTNKDGWTDTVDLQPLMFYFTLDTATEFLYGQSVNSQAAIAGLESSKNGIDGAAFSYHFGAAKHLVDKRGALGKFFWLMPMRELKMHCKAIHEVIDKMIADGLDSKKDLLSMEEKGARKFVLLDELAKETQDLKELRNETLHTLMAGRDPTGALLGWVWYFLSRHPDVFSKLRETVLNQFGISINSPITEFSDLRRCDYLQWVINEVIRIVAIIPMNERVALKDTTLPKGGGEDGSKPIFVRKGIQILIPLYAIQHRPDIWGEDGEEFRPERWQGRRIGWEWIPFGGGARKCLGRKFTISFGLQGLLLMKGMQSNSLLLKLVIVL
jgi:cytochrome P450